MLNSAVIPMIATEWLLFP